MKMNLKIGMETRARLHRLFEEVLEGMVKKNCMSGHACDSLKPLENAGPSVDEVLVEVAVQFTMYHGGKRITQKQWELAALEAEVLGQRGEQCDT